MSGDILTLLGGTGMFLLGMRMMTGALGELASRQTRAVLRRVTTSPLTGAVAGAAPTALIHSSSATRGMAHGFWRCRCCLLRGFSWRSAAVAGDGWAVSLPASAWSFSGST